MGNPPLLMGEKFLIIIIEINQVLVLNINLKEFLK
jgi:hypothetical protein